MVKLSFQLLVCLLILMALAANAKPPDTSISVDDAYKLVEAAIYPNMTKAELDQAPNSYEPDFIIFGAVDPNPDHNGHMGFFAVNVLTGDVWSTAGHCRRITSPRLIKMQKSIRAHLKIAATEFKKHQAKKPVCDAD
jgi:hypothetical protein